MKTCFLVLFAMLLLLPVNSFGQASEIPDWIRDNAGWWSLSQISDQDFVKGIEYLADKGIIKIPSNTTIGSDSDESIPSWLKNNAGWWSEGLLSDNEFIKGMQYLADKGIIHVQQGDISCSGKELCISSIVERIVDGDTIHIEGYKVRLSLTNTPERGESGFAEATEFTKRMCPIGSHVIVDQDDMQTYDTYGRLLGKVYCDDMILNLELLDNGHANILTQYCSTSEFSNDAWAQQYGCKELQESKRINKEIPKAEQDRENCDPSYPDVCIQPSPPDLDCKDIPFKRFTVIPPDPHRFDGDKDGIGCES